MRKMILMMPVSADGFIEGPEREPDRHKADDEPHHHFNEQLAAMGAFLTGRVTCELMAVVWPALDTRVEPQDRTSGIRAAPMPSHVCVAHTGRARPAALAFLTVGSVNGRLGWRCLSAWCHLGWVRHQFRPVL
jgi:hypothetical protein